MDNGGFRIAAGFADHECFKMRKNSSAGTTQLGHTFHNIQELCPQASSFFSAADFGIDVLYASTIKSNFVLLTLELLTDTSAE